MAVDCVEAGSATARGGGNLHWLSICQSIPPLFPSTRSSSTVHGVRVFSGANLGPRNRMGARGITIDRRAGLIPPWVQQAYKDNTAVVAHYKRHWASGKGA